MKSITETIRGCGRRKEGGLYLFGKGYGYPCRKLPIPLTVCHCCGNGIKFSRAFQWIKWDLLQSRDCDGACGQCPLGQEQKGKLGLIWIGEQFYPSTLDFNREANVHGISRRILFLPKGFEIGKTWVALAHREAVFVPEDESFIPGIFRLFIPTEVQYVAKGDETEEQIERMEKRGITPVHVEYHDELSAKAQTSLV